MNNLAIPYVVADAHTDTFDNYNDLLPTTISADYELAAFTAVNYLIENGHKNIAFISSSYIPNFYLKTFEVINALLKQLNYPFNLHGYSQCH